MTSVIVTGPLGSRIVELNEDDTTYVSTGTGLIIEDKSTGAAPTDENVTAAPMVF